MEHNILNDVENSAQSQVTPMHTYRGLNSMSVGFVPNNVPYGNRNQSSAGVMASSHSLKFDLQELQGKEKTGYIGPSHKIVVPGDAFSSIGGTIMYAPLSYIRDGGESMVGFLDTNVMSKRS